MTTLAEIPTPILLSLLELRDNDLATTTKHTRKAIKAELYRRTEERLGLATRGLSPQDEGAPDLRRPHPRGREIEDRGSSTYKWLDDLDVGPGKTGY